MSPIRYEPQADGKLAARIAPQGARADDCDQGRFLGDLPMLRKLQQRLANNASGATAAIP
jgi:hypothetical protein